MLGSVRRKIVCKYCGYHMPANKTRCPFCGTYVDPKPVKADDYELRNIIEKMKGHRNDMPGAIYILEYSSIKVEKIIKLFVKLIVVLCILFGLGIGGRILYHKFIFPEIKSSEEEDLIGKLMIISANPLIERAEPSLSAASLNSITPDREYSVYEIIEAEGYTWYRIGVSDWISDDGTQVKYIPEGGTVSE